MSNVLPILIFGVSYGLILFLLATGLTLTMGLMRVVNMSHGALYMIAGFLGIWIVRQTGSWVMGVIAAAALAALLGFLLEIAFLRRLYEHPTNQVLLTIGFIYIITNVTLWIWGPQPLGTAVPKLLSGSVTVGNVNVPVFRFFIIGFGVLMAILLWLLQDKTRTGAMVRAGMDNREVAGTLGMNLKTLFTAVFAIGSLVAGLSSLIGGSLTGISQTTGWDVLLYSIIVVVVGGTGSIQGALLGGVIIGLVYSFGTAYFPNLSSFIIYAVLIIILLIRPSGLLGRKMDMNRAVEGGLERGGAPASKQRIPHWSKEEMDLRGIKSWRSAAYRFTPYLIALLFLIAIPNFIGTYTQSMMTKVLIFALFAASLDMIMGYTGMNSFGHAAFFGMGGYMVGILTKHFGIDSFWLIFVITLLSSAALSAIIGYFTLRLSGVYFLLVTMAFGQLMSVVATKWYSLTNGTDGLTGIPKPDFGFPVNWTSARYYYFVLFIFVICYYLVHRIMHSSYGRSLVGVRENEGRMRSLGFNTWALKYGGVILAGVFAGVAGLLYAYAYGTMVPSILGLETSALPMLMVIMGGGATLWGPVLGAVVIILVQNYAGIYFSARWPLVLGVLFVICVMLLRGGFASYLTNFWNWLGSRIFFGKKILEPVSEENRGEDFKL